MDDLKQELLGKIKTLNETIWENRASRPKVEDWLSNFGDVENEGLHALYLLAHFMYFGSREMRELLKALYRDLYRYPIIETIRKTHSNTLDMNIIQQEFEQQLLQTRFIGMGNPSESGCHLLYYFRQENRLSKHLFIHTHEIFSRSGSPPSLSVKEPKVTKYVFLDDFCGSGRQAKYYSRNVLKFLKSLKPNAKTAYYVLFATDVGLREICQNTLFDSVDAVFKLDESYKCFGKSSRYFIKDHTSLDKDFNMNVCLKYGKHLWSKHPLGYDDGQLLIGFHHNTPDNTLPIIWYDKPEGPTWKPIFRRYPKIYGWVSNE